LYTDSEALRPKLPEALATSSVALETTEATGFAGKRRLPRKLLVREAP
jgi:hypothetical protein